MISISLSLSTSLKTQKENKYMGGNINKWLFLDGQQVRVTCHPQVLNRRKQYLGYLVPN
jgi:hypothetical protein